MLMKTFQTKFTVLTFSPRQMYVQCKVQFVCLRLITYISNLCKSICQPTKLTVTCTYLSKTTTQYPDYEEIFFVPRSLDCQTKVLVCLLPRIPLI